MSVGQRVIRVGTRGSALALQQTRLVVDALQASRPLAARELAVETCIISTSGDRDKQTPLAVLGGQGVFAKELELALLAGEIDLAVHSAKDLTSVLSDGLTIGAIPAREDARDVLVSRDGYRLRDLSPGSSVGTSSRRRAMQLRQLRPDLEVIELRGNIDTRLSKIAEGRDGLSAGIMAAAGIVRMGWAERIAEYLPLDVFVPAPGQGALAVECRADDDALLRILAEIDDADSAAAVEAERAFLREIGGGCRAPLGAHASVDSEVLTLHAMLADEEMTEARFAIRSVERSRACVMAAELAVELRRAVEGEAQW